MNVADKIAQAMAQQDYDANPPRCLTCVYYVRQPERPYCERTMKGRRNTVRHVRVKLKAHPHRNPLVDRCTFGNFIVKPSAVCDEWHSREGERIEYTTPEDASR